MAPKNPMWTTHNLLQWPSRYSLQILISLIFVVSVNPFNICHCQYSFFPSSFMAMIASVTMNFPHISTHNISSNQTFSPICTNNPSNFSSSSSSSIPISSNSIRLSSSIAYSEQLIASHNVNRRTKNRKIKVSMYD